MLLQNAEQTASFSPLDVLVNWGFSMNQAVPSLYADLLQPPELTNALHEFTHQHAMFSEMGLWFLHNFWKFLAQAMNGHFGLTLMTRDRLWDAWWLTSFLLEGHATFAQLHLYPSSRTDAACPQHTFLFGLGLHTTFIRPKATELTSYVQEMNEETARLFRAASRDAHGLGLKYKLLLSNQDWAQPQGQRELWVIWAGWRPGWFLRISSFGSVSWHLRRVNRGQDPARRPGRDPLLLR